LGGFVELPENWEEELESYQLKSLAVERYSLVYDPDVYIFSNGISIKVGNHISIEIEGDDGVNTQLEKDIELLLGSLKFKKKTKRNRVTFQNILYSYKGEILDLLWSLYSIGGREITQSPTNYSEQIKQYSWKKMQIEKYHVWDLLKTSPETWMYLLPNGILADGFSNMIRLTQDGLGVADVILRELGFKRLEKKYIEFQLPSQYLLNHKFYDLLWNLSVIT
jgi:hypothetical protein